MILIDFSERQKKIIEVVKENEPITSEHIAKLFNVTRATLRTDLAILTMSGILDARPKVGYFYAGDTAIDLVSEKIKSIKVKEILSLPVVIDEQTSLYDAIVTLFLENVGTIFIVSKGYLSGVVSRKDFLKNIMGGTDINKVPIGLIMTRMPNIVVTYPEETVVEAATKIIEHEIDSLPVVEEIKDNKKKNYKVIGKITKTNLAKLLVEIATKN